MGGHPAVIFPQHELGETDGAAKQSADQRVAAEFFRGGQADEAGDSNERRRYQADHRKNGDKDVRAVAPTVAQAGESLGVAVGIEAEHPGHQEQHDESANRYGLEDTQRGHVAPLRGSTFRSP